MVRNSSDSKGSVFGKLQSEAKKGMKEHMARKKEEHEKQLKKSNLSGKTSK